VESQIWHQYGSVAGLSKIDYPRQVRDQFQTSYRFFGKALLKNLTTQLQYFN
jgi:hypothetical protein